MEHHLACDMALMSHDSSSISFSSDAILIKTNKDSNSKVEFQVPRAIK